MGEDIYLFMIIALAILAITDLVVGVSNDAVNFLNSAIGSKAISFRTIMIVASIGIAFGALSSSGMMEVARKGIFNPSQFYFEEIMIIFMAVMITDVLLLDFFNTLGMPTSTTVSIVFELLGAAVAVSLIKVAALGENAGELASYINTTKATEIIVGILLSVVIAFTIGAVVQFISRSLLSFRFRQRPPWAASIFGGVAITAIVYFILVKGLKSTNLLQGAFVDFVSEQTVLFLLINAAIWSLICWVVNSLFNINVYRIVIVFGTFALAMAFAGNDLVNFIGVPIAALQAYQDWAASGVPATEYSMGGLATAVQTPTLLLLLSGVVMILTLWFSSKALFVTETEINLAREGEGEERFQPNYLSRFIVRVSINAHNQFIGFVPTALRDRISKQFEKPKVYVGNKPRRDAPAFDMVRAAVNLMVASVLISIATSMKLPLSTTYVTFMVAMGSSLADRAWGSESAVYRVAGVLNVIGGWFFTAISAFVAAALIAYLLHIGGTIALISLLILAVILLVRNYLSHTKKSKELKEEFKLRRTESSNIQGVIDESSKNIALAIKRVNKIYTLSIEGLSKHDISILKKSKKGIAKLDKEVEGLQDHIYYFIKNLEESSVGTSNFYITVLKHLQDMTQSVEYISKAGYKHVNNNHKKLRFNQIKDLKDMDGEVEELFNQIREIFENKDFERINSLIMSKQNLLKLVDEKIENQVIRTRGEETSPKNTALYINILSETKDMLTSTMNLLDLYDQHANEIRV